MTTNDIHHYYGVLDVELKIDVLLEDENSERLGVDMANS